MGRIGRPAALAALVMCAVAAAASPKPAAAETLHRVITGLTFGDAPIAAHVGDVIQWENKGFLAHTVTARDGSFDVAIPAGKTGSIVVRHAGKTPFYCRFHPNMKGVLNVAP
jgi:plastocyanin